MKPRLHLGRDALTGSDIILELLEVLVHWAIFGSSGSGKSRLLSTILAFCIDWKIPVILLDPGRQLYDYGLSYAAISGNASRVCAINPNDQHYSFGIDWLKRYQASPVTVAEQFNVMLGKVYGRPEGTVQPLVETWLRNCVLPLVESPDATLAEMLEFASSDRSALRNAILKQTKNEYIRREWQSFDSLKRSEREHLVMAVHNRAARISIPDEARRMMGQVRPPFDIGEAIEQGKIVLINLAPERVSREFMRGFGITMVNGIINYGQSRNPSKPLRKALVICDESPLYSSDELPMALDTMRKFGIFFVLCYQTLAQVEKIPGYVDSLLANSRIKIAFRTSRRDAEELVGEMFPDGLIRREIKDEIIRTVWEPNETTRTVRSRARSNGHSTSHGDSSGFSDGMTSGNSSSWAISSQPMSIAEDTHSFGVNSTYSTSSVDSYGTSSSESESYSESETETVVPFYEYLRSTEISSRTFYSVEELRERFISWFLLQPTRHAQVKIGDKATTPIITAYVEDIRVRDRDRQRVIERSNQKYALPVAVVDRMIEERRARLLESAAQETIKEAEALEESRWH